MAASLQTRSDSGQLSLLGEKPPDVLISPPGGRRAIEDEEFLFEKLSEIAEAESCLHLLHNAKWLPAQASPSSRHGMTEQAEVGRHDLSG